MDVARHHAWLVEAKPTEAVVLWIKQLFVNAEFSIVRSNRMSVSEARALLAEVQTTSSAACRVALVLVEEIGSEAQNALLKFIEEPPAGVVVVIIIPDRERLLSTVRSRLQVLPYEQTIVVNPTWERFYDASLADRLEQLAAYAKDKDAPAFAELRRGCEDFLADAPALTLDAKRAALLALRYSGRAGASAKMLFEHVALALPTLRR